MSNFRSRKWLMFVFVLVLAVLLVTTQSAQAQSKNPDPWTGQPPDNILPLPPLRARVDPPPIPVPLPKSPAKNPRLPADESVAINTSQVTKVQNNVLAAGGAPCLRFDGDGDWGSLTSGYRVWDDQFAGWAPFAVDDGGIYEIENVVFAREKHNQAGESAFKIESGEPYAAGLASPIIEVQKGDIVTVKVSYLIYPHAGVPRDWASLGVKADAHARCLPTDDPQCYVNGYVRGRWAELSHTVTATSDEVMILLQAESPENLNSNIYFDNLEIQVNGIPKISCERADSTN